MFQNFLCRSVIWYLGTFSHRNSIIPGTWAPSSANLSHRAITIPGWIYRIRILWSEEMQEGGMVTLSPVSQQRLLLADIWNGWLLTLGTFPQFFRAFSHLFGSLTQCSSPQYPSIARSLLECCYTQASLHPQFSTLQKCLSSPLTWLGLIFTLLIF